MEVIGEHYGPLPQDETIVDQYFWEFDVKEMDFFLRTKPTWQTIKTNGFHISIDGNIVVIPLSFYVLIGDFNGDLDWIKIEETVSRDFEAFVMSSNFRPDIWQILPFRVIGFEEDEFYFPNTKNPVPIYMEGGKSIMVSSTDMYHKMKHCSFSDIIGDHET